MVLIVEAATAAGCWEAAHATPESPVQRAAASAPAYGPAQAKNLASARLTARLQHRQIEALSERTDASQTFVNADGTLTYTAFAVPKWTRHGSSWVNLDATLQLRADGTVAPVAAESGLVLSGGGSRALASLTVDGRKMSLTWPTPLPMPSLSGATATYENVGDGIDLQVTASPSGGVEETLVVKTAAAGSDPTLNDLAQSLSTGSGVHATADAGGNLTVKDGAGRLLVNSPAPVMWDSATATDTGAAARGTGNDSAAATGSSDGPQPDSDTRSTAQGPGRQAHQAPVKASLKDHKLHLVPDRSLLSAKSTVFPVYIDPAYVPHPASGSTMHWDEVQQAYPTTSNYDVNPSGGNGVGYQGFSAPKGIERTYYQVSIPWTIYGSNVLSASMKMTESKSSDCSTSSYAVQAWSVNAFGSGLNWNNAPGKVAQQSSVNFGPACNGATPTGTFNFMNQVTNAAVNHWPNISFVLVNSSETNDVQLKRFSSSASLSITYNSPPGVPTLLGVSPGPGYGSVGQTLVHSSKPTFSAGASDQDGDTVRMDFQVLQGTTVKASGSSPFVNSDIRGSGGGSWTSTTALADGSYTWKVRAYDGRDYSAWTATQLLTVDTKAPASSSVASSDFPAGAWSGTPDASGNFSGSFTFTPPTADIANVRYNLDSTSSQGPVLPTTGTPVTATLSFPAGRHSVTAWSEDAAGNFSAATTYVFYAGSGAALLTPAAGDRPARRVTLSGQGKSGENQVTYQYRIGETDAWHNVPVADVTVGPSGAAVTSWPQPVPSGASVALTWNITDTLAQDGPVDVRAVFTDGTTDDNSPPNTITVDRNAGSAPALAAGPASVNALTGDASISATDASEFDMSTTRTASSRQPASGSAQEGQVAIFGPQWTAGTVTGGSDSPWSYLHKTSSTSVALVDVDGDPTGFTAAAGGGWKSEPGAEDLTLSGSLTGSFTLKDTDGATTTFAKVDPAATSWQVASTTVPGDDATTQVVSERVTVGSTVLARPKYVIAPTSAVTQPTCAMTPSAKGCRVLEYVYAASTTASASAFGDYAGQVSQIRLWATDPDGSAATAVAVAQYAYDTAGRLRQEWDPRISPALKTAYDYDSDGRITTLTPAGELPWTFAYGNVGSGATAGEGMFLSASRPTLTPGSSSQTNGTAYTSMVYEVPLSGSSAPYAMSGGDVATWGQSDAPTDATALFPADAVPTTHDGSAMSADDYRRATITYTDASGREVNAANPGGHITTTEYDRFGNTVRELTAANRDLALATSGPSLNEQQRLGIDALPSADRAQILSTASVYNTASVAADAGTDRDTDPADAGQRELQRSGPLHLVTLAATLSAGTGGTDLPAGSLVAARQHTVTSYDQGRPTDGTATVANQATTVTVGAAVDGYPADGDTRTSTTGYDWVKGLPTQTVTDPTGLNLVKTTSYDAQGRVVRTTLPKSDGTDAGATVTTYWSATGTGTCTGRPEWADLVCTVGPAGAITGGGSNPAQLPTKTMAYDRYGNVITVTETANGTTRTRSNTYDSAGRLTNGSVAGGAGSVVSDVSTTYDPATGKVAATATGGHSVGHVYDALGRLVSYSDGAGNTTTTWYDALDRRIKVTDSAPSTTTYAYDTSAEPRGLETSRTDSVAGTFTATYDQDGNQATESLPGGYTLTVTRDEAGTSTGRTYTRDSDGTEVTRDTATETVQGQRATHSSDTSDQVYGYDTAGRLTTVDGLQDGIPTHRTYAFDDDTNRTGLTTTVDNPDGTAGSPATTTYTYDSADRLQSGGGTEAVVYDAFGRTTTQASGATVGYYNDDHVREQTSADGANRQTWTLDADERSASATSEIHSTGTWTQTKTTTNHYGDDTDDPEWTVEEPKGTVTRDVQGTFGGLVATTTSTGGTILQLTDLHGDVTVQLPLDTSDAITALTYDEYGNPEDTALGTDYGWLGARQRSADTPTGSLLMGFRLYDPTIGRFLQTDPVPGGAANAYDYAAADPVNAADVSGAMMDCGGGRTGSQCYTPYNSSWKYIYSTRVVGGWHESSENRLPYHVKVVIQTIMGLRSYGIYVEGIWYRNKYNVRVYGRYHHGRYQTKYSNYSIYRQQGKIKYFIPFWGDVNIYTPWVSTW